MASIEVRFQLPVALHERLVAVADHPAVVDVAEVIRDCIGAQLPYIELALGFKEPEQEEPEEPVVVKEDRSAGCFGAAPKAG